MEKGIIEKQAAGNISRVEMLNARTASIPYKNALEMGINKVKGLIIDQDTNNESGEIENVSYIILEDGQVLGGTSYTACNSILEAMDILNDGEPLSVRVSKDTSNSGREFVKLIWS